MRDTTTQRLGTSRTPSHEPPQRRSWAPPRSLRFGRRAPLASASLLALLVAAVASLPGCSDSKTSAAAKPDAVADGADGATAGDGGFSDGVFGDGGFDDTATDATADAGPATLPAPTTRVTFLNSGPARLEVNLDRRDLRLSWDGVERTVLDLDELRIGRVPKVDSERNYAPTTLAEVPIDDLTWLGVTDATFVAHPVIAAKLPGGLALGSDGVTLAIAVTDTFGKPAPGWQLHIDSVGQGGFRCRLELADAVERVAQAQDLGKPQVIYTGIAARRGPAERFYGLGEWFDRPEHTGTIRPMQIEVALETVSGYNEAHVPVPFVIGTSGWALFVENRRPALFDVAKTDKERVKALFYSAGFDFWLFAAAQPLTLVNSYTRVTGAPAMPASWALGPLIWRNENKSDAEVLDDMAAIRSNDLAITGMWFDRPFDTHVNNFEFDPKRFLDAETMLKTVHAGGFATAMWSTPYVEKGATQFDKVTAAKWFVDVPSLAKQFLNWGPPLDLTNPDVMAFWRDQISKMAKRGISGWKLDFAEDIHPGLFQVRTHFNFHDGSDERTMHHGYPLFYHQPYVDNLPASGGFILARAGTYGGQTLASMIWPGDLDASFHPNGWCEGGAPCSGDKPHVGGLPSSVSAMLGLAASGYPVYAADTGGYRGGRPTKALFLRWMAQTTFSVAMQLGGSKQCNPWDFDTYVGEWGTSTFDAEVLDAARLYTRLHMRLNPYIYSLLADAHAHKPGPMRPFGLVYPELIKVDGFLALADTQYLLGDAMLVAPVVDELQGRDVLIPGGVWFDWWTHKQVTTPAGTSPGAGYVVTRAVGPAEIPVWLKAGAVVPMLRPTVDSLYPATDAKVDSFANDAGRLHVVVAPGPASSRVLYDGTHLGQKPAGKATEITVAPGALFTKGWELEIWQPGQPKTVAVDGAVVQSVPDEAGAQTCTACWWHDGKTGTLHVRLAAGGHAVAVLPE